MRKHVTIYIDEGVWESAKEISWSQKKSASRWVEDLIIANRVVEVPVMDAGQRAEGQAKLDAARKGRSIKKEKIEKSKSTGFFNPQLKK